MTQRIIITSNETIVCPKCDHHFPLDQGITRQTIERYEPSLIRRLQTSARSLKLKLKKELSVKQLVQFSGQIAKLNEQIAWTKQKQRMKQKNKSPRCR